MPSRALARVGMLRSGQMPACLPDAVRRESMAHGLFDCFPGSKADALGVPPNWQSRFPAVDYFLNLNSATSGWWSEPTSGPTHERSTRHSLPASTWSMRAPCQRVNFV